MDRCGSEAKPSVSTMTMPECPIARSTFTTFMDEGHLHFKAKHFRKAVYCFDRALELKPNNKTALVQRSQCYLKLGDAKSALRDAEASFKIDGEFQGGLYQYAEALYNLGQFELAAIAYHRGYRARGGSDEFRIGVRKCQRAINNAIGDKQGTQIEDLDTLLPKIKEMNDELEGLTKHCCVMDSPEEIDRRRRLRNRKEVSRARDKWVDREVLGVLQKDKDYLTKFLKRPDIEGDQQGQGGAGILREAAKDALQYLKIRENFWRQQNPMYARKIGLNFNNDIVLKYEEQERERMEATRRVKQDAAKGAVMRNMEEIEHALQIGRSQDALLECTRALRQIKEVSLRLMPEKPKYVCEILHMKGLAAIKLKNYEVAIGAFQEEYNVANQSKMADVKGRAMDYLGRSYAFKGCYIEAAEVWDARLSAARGSLEKAYLNHEIGRCYYEMSKMDLALTYGKNSLDEALKIEDWIWAMNAAILMGQCHIVLNAFDVAEELFARAEEYAVKCNNKGNISLLREGQHCIRAYLERKATSPPKASTPITPRSDSPLEADDFDSTTFYKSSFRS